MREPKHINVTYHKEYTEWSTDPCFRFNSIVCAPKQMTLSRVLRGMMRLADIEGDLGEPSGFTVWTI